MLGQDYKFHFQNDTGVQLDFSSNGTNEKLDLDFRQWKFDSNGALEYSASEVNQAYSASDVADGAGAELTAVDNATNKYIGMHGIFTVETDNASADGTVTLYIEYATDGTGTVFPSDATDFVRSEDLRPVATVIIGGAEKRAVNFEI